MNIRQGKLSVYEKKRIKDRAFRKRNEKWRNSNVSLFY